MECLWRLFSHWQPYGDSHDENPAVFYLCINSNGWLPDYSLYGAGFLEKYAKVYLGRKTESLVLFMTGRHAGHTGLTAEIAW